MATQPQLNGGSNGRFGLVYVVGEKEEGAITTSVFTNAAWESASPTVGNGRWPTIMLDGTDEIHLAWCSSGNEIRYAAQDGLEIISNFSCNSAPRTGIRQPRERFI